MKSLLRSTLVVSACNAAVQILTFLTQILVARQFGAGAELDGYWVAAAVTQFVVAVGVTAVALAFLPEHLARRKADGETAARRLTSGVINTMSAALLLLSALAVFWREPLLRLLAPGLTDVSFRAAAAVAVVLWPSVALSGVIQIQLAYQQGAGRFAWPAVIGVGSAASVAGLVLVLGPKVGILGFALAIAAGLLLQVVLLAFSAPSSPHVWTVEPGDPGVLRVFSLSLPLMASALFSGAAPLIERYLASQVGVGTISHLAYASRIVTAEMILVSTGLATVLFPRFAMHTVSNDQFALGRLFSTSVRYASFVLLPLCLTTAVLARPLVTFAFQRGSFGPEDSASVAGILQIYALALPPMALGTLVGRVMYSLKANRVVALMAAGYLVAYWILASWFSREWGASGIAAATAICLSGGFLFGLAYVHAHTPRGSWAGIVGMAVRTFAATGAAGLVMWLVRDAIAEPAAAFAFAAVAGAITYFLVLAALRSNELREIVQQLRAGATRAES